jgi:serine phosphatase RsbU (regulator of sigma subunit)
MASLTIGCVEWAAASAAASGSTGSGDEFCVRPLAHGVLVAALDGLGHGPAAAAAARLTVSLLEMAPADSLPALVRECHRRLHGTRGLVMSLAMFDCRRDTMAWIGIGNVAGMLWNAASRSLESLLLRSGVVGAVLPELKATTMRVSAGDTLVLATDGVAHSFVREIERGRSPHDIANGILARHSRGTDDALALVARYRGGSA